MSDGQTMHLDPAIRDWVLFPIMVVMILVGVLRHLASVLMQSRPKTSVKGIRETCALGRARLLRGPTAAYIPRLAFDARRLFLIEGFAEKKYLKVQDENEAVNPMDPAGMEAMTGMLKTNMMMLIPQTLIMSWITYFFSGFILIKLPFPLTLRFKSMLQRGIETSDMDVKWVSSLSWYFLNLFGLKSIYSLILGGGNAAGGISDMQQMGQMAPQQAPMQQPKEVANMFKSEKEFLELGHHEWLLDDVEFRLLKKYQRIPEDQEGEMQDDEMVALPTLKKDL